MDALTQDLLLVSGRAGGLRAAIAATDLNPKRKIAFVSKVYSGIRLRRIMLRFPLRSSAARLELIRAEEIAPQEYQ